MSFDRNLLPDPISYFEGQNLRLNGRGKWRTTECRFHGGSDSLRINTASGGWVCMNCGVKGGDVLAYAMQLSSLEFVEAAKQLGAWIDDGRPAQHYKPAPLPPRAALSVMALEATLVAIEGTRIGNGLIPTPEVLTRVRVAAGRINRIVEAYQ